MTKRPHDGPAYIATGPLIDTANLIAVMVAEFANRPDLTDAERGGAKAAHAALQYAAGLAWARAYDASKAACGPSREAAE